MERVEEERSIERALSAEASIYKTRRIILFTIIAAIMVMVVLMGIILNDISKLYRQRKALSDATRESTRLASVKQEFLSNVSHEIRTPLTAILGFAEQLQYTSLNEAQKDHLKKIVKSSDHLMMLINDILDLSKIEKEKLILDEIPFKPMEELQESVSIVKPLIMEKNIDLRITVDDLEDLVLHGDPFRYRQVLINILNNAAKFTDQGQIEIKATSFKDGEKTRLRTAVKDTGIGISDNLLPRIFDYFVQAEVGDTEHQTGTGLGLSIAKNLVEIQGGFIKVKSKEGKGSEFTFEIPYTKGTRDDLQRDIKSAKSSIPSYDPSTEILIVDDNSYNLELMAAILEKSKAKCTKSGSGADALEMLEDHNYDIALMDVQMPGMSGPEVFKKFREKHPSDPLPFVAVTANPELTLVTELEEMGFVAVIAKPFTERQIFEAVEAIIPSLSRHEGFQQDEGRNPTTSDEPYQLDALLQLSDGNRDFQINMVELFLKNMRGYMIELDKSLKHNDYEAAAAIAHKAIPPCRHLKIDGMVEKLKLIEQTCKQNLPDIPTINFQALEYDWNQVRDMLEKDIAEIKRKLDRNTK
jgi:signal transduction histidine kinase/CheY-like chemotaxis protein